jgi:hypothetical protein
MDMTANAQLRTLAVWCGKPRHYALALYSGISHIVLANVSVIEEMIHNVMRVCWRLLGFEPINGFKAHRFYHCPVNVRLFLGGKDSAQIGLKFI